MIIHTVHPNETINSIAESYGISAEKLAIDNQITDPNRLIVGQSLLVLFPEETYQVMDGDNLADIAASYGIPMMQLLRNNPQLFDRKYIYPGENLIVSLTDEKIMEISTNGYAFPFIDISLLQKTLPYLTYLTIFYYRITMDGGIVDINDQELINTARGYGVAPIMLISTLTDTKKPDVKATHNILTNTEVQENLINRVLENIKAKDYYGLNIDIQNILQEDKQLFIDFIANISNRVRQAGYPVFITLTPNTFPTETGDLYRGPEYTVLGQLVDSVMLLSYQWGNVSSPQPALPIEEVRDLLDYSITQLPPEKINIGIPVIGYIWQLPFIAGSTVANAISHNSAHILAMDVGAEIQRDLASQAPYFTYITDKEYIVWFRDVRSVGALLELVVEYGIEGIGTWNIMQFSSGLWLLINASFDIKKVL
ncbi:MAG: LysM peptidoglycan-binding domain-containing protein [Clostridiales bacterium]|nr:LysM peptidoglycan-binding domain-containing protein [Clostridiales bacterium]